MNKAGLISDVLRHQRGLVDDMVVAFWRELHILSVDNMTRADIELWYQLTKHGAIARKLGDAAWDQHERR